MDIQIRGQADETRRELKEEEQKTSEEKHGR